MEARSGLSPWLRLAEFASLSLDAFFLSLALRGTRSSGALGCYHHQ